MSQDPILRTRLFIPPFKSEYLPRPQLLDIINLGIQNRLVLLSAPAGYGKTTLIAEWITRQTMPTAWLSLDRSINDASTFLKYTIASLQNILPDMGENIRTSMTVSPNSPLKTLAYTFINEICDLERDIALVLDDFHCIEDPDTIQLVSDIIHDQPPQLHMLITSRSDLPFSYHRLLAREEMTVLGIDELRFKPQEANEYLNKRLGETITLDERELLYHQTEGWIAGLQMAAISIRSGYNRHSDISSFSGENRYISDYLMNEVLKKQKTDVTNFLIQTSILDKFNASLCDRVTGQENSQAILEYLEQTGLFLIPLDDHRTWYRYHHLFTDLLHSRLELQNSGVITDLHRRAATWFEEHACDDDAIEHWLTAHEYECVIRYLQNRIYDILASGKWATYLRWLDQIPDEYLMKSPRLLVHQVFLLWEMGLLEKFFRQLELTEKVLEPIPEDLDSLDIETVECLSILTIVKGMKLTVEHHFDIAENTDQYISLVHHLPEQFPLWRAMLVGTCGYMHQISCNYTEAIQWYGQAAKLASDTGMVLPLFIYSTAQIVLYLITGQYTKAINAADILINMDVQQKHSIPFSGLTYSVMGELLYLRGDITIAAEYTRHGIQLISNDGEVYTMSYAYFTLARILAARNDLSGVKETLDTMMNSLHEMQAPQTALIIAKAYQAQMWISCGNIESAASWLNDTGVDQIDKEKYPDIMGCSFIGMYNTIHAPFNRYTQIIEMITAKTELGLGRNFEALKRLDFLLEQNARLNDKYYLIQLYLMKALALFHTDQDGQEDALIASILPAVNEQCYQLFIDEGNPMRVLLEKTRNFLKTKKSTIAQSEQIVHFITCVLERMNPEQETTGNKKKSNADAYGITPREKMVLEQLAHGLSYDEIAQSLVVSPNTIRTHINRLYRKMDVRNRLQAVNKAIDLGWLENEKHY